jgi:hypothetical protein
MRLCRCARWLTPVLMLLLVPTASFAGVLISVNIAPPILPVYEQPLCPQDGWMWVPGYWAYGDDGYYWVPGEWVPAPYQGALWTPAWWGWDGGHYVFHDGYWGDRVGYYGGIDYGFGYMGIGFVGGEWRGGAFAYNTAVMRVNRDVIHNTYVNETIVRSNTIANTRHVAFTGGPNGIHHDPTPAEREAMSGHHTPATAAQLQHVQAARADRTSYAKANGGHPHTLSLASSNGEGRTAGARSAGERPATRETTRPGASARTAPAERTAPKSESQRAVTRTTPESRTTQATSESHTAKSARPESRTTIAKTEPRSETHTAPSRTESRPSPSKTEPRTETHTASSRTESHPSTAREETRREPRTAPAEKPKTESQSHPAPQHESHPAPAAHPAPQHAAHSEPQPKQEKPKPESK